VTIRSFKDRSPTIPDSAYVDPSALLIGDVELGEAASLWPMAVARGDVNHIRIGARTNIQDGSVLHVTHAHGDAPGGHPLVIGDEVTVGHKVTLHGCTVGDRCLIGMGSIVLDGAVLDENVLLGAGSLVPPGKVLDGGALWLGSPVRRVRALTADEIKRLAYSAEHYVRLAAEYRSG
jgi:carbonic anhydrase/acetyltransferase-like protein (isoleucine patch superfamily)